MQRRGEISMEVIIIAAIALLVLVILSVLILRAGGNINEGTSCTGIGGVCEDSCEFLEGHVPNAGGQCSNPDYVCCVPIGTSDE